jgi:hypothetical protein
MQPLWRRAPARCAAGGRPASRRSRGPPTGVHPPRPAARSESRPRSAVPGSGWCQGRRARPWNGGTARPTPRPTRRRLRAGRMPARSAVACVAAAPAKPGRSRSVARMARTLTATAAHTTAGRITRLIGCRPPHPHQQPASATRDWGSARPSAVQAMTVPASHSAWRSPPDRGRAACSTPLQLGQFPPSDGSRLPWTLWSAGVMHGRDRGPPASPSVYGY